MVEGFMLILGMLGMLLTASMACSTILMYIVYRKDGGDHE